ncbi:3-hydroxyisobutyrate dehydrogenase, partial [Pseudomonas sp. BN411]
MHIGFLGLGNMGGPMARNLLKAGHTLTVFDPSPLATAALVELGARTSNSPAELARDGVAAIITMLPTAAHVKDVYLGAEGLLANVQPGVLLIDSSTIDPLSAREVAKAAASQGNPMLDAPVSGGTGGAAAGTLTFMVGGTVSAFDEAHLLLAAMGKNIVYCGDTGNGQVAKIANNMLLGISMVGVAEAMALGVALGMDAKVLAGIINTSSGRCWSSEINNPFPGVL